MLVDGSGMTTVLLFNLAIALGKSTLVNFPWTPFRHNEVDFELEKVEEKGPDGAVTKFDFLPTGIDLSQGARSLPKDKLKQIAGWYANEPSHAGGILRLKDVSVEEKERRNIARLARVRNSN
jgi:hypothetical protein